MSTPQGGLILVATPLGNLGDLSRRAEEALRAAELWFVEDSRVSARLQQHLEVKTKMLRLDEHTPDSKLASYAKDLASGVNAVLVTDAGTPGISDPGARLADLCYDLGVPVDAVPGPSAVTLALSLSGFFAQRFAFLGYLPRKSGDIAKELRPFVDSTLTLVLFESPYRVDKTLETAKNILGDRRCTICRELTKMHQQVERCCLGNLPILELMPRKGEFTIVIEGKRKGGDSSASSG